MPVSVPVYVSYGWISFFIRRSGYFLTKKNHNNSVLVGSGLFIRDSMFPHTFTPHPVIFIEDLDFWSKWYRIDTFISWVFKLYFRYTTRILYYINTAGIIQAPGIGFLFACCRFTLIMGMMWPLWPYVYYNYLAICNN